MSIIDNQSDTFLVKGWSPIWITTRHTTLGWVTAIENMYIDMETYIICDIILLNFGPNSIAVSKCGFWQIINTMGTSSENSLRSNPSKDNDKI